MVSPNSATTPPKPAETSSSLTMTRQWRRRAPTNPRLFWGKTSWVLESTNGKSRSWRWMVATFASGQSTRKTIGTSRETITPAPCASALIVAHMEWIDRMVISQWQRGISLILWWISIRTNSLPQDQTTNMCIMPMGWRGMSMWRFWGSRREARISWASEGNNKEMLKIKAKIEKYFDLKKNKKF